MAGDASPDPTQDDGEGTTGEQEEENHESTERNETTVKVRAHDQSVEISSYDASAEELQKLAQEQLEFQFREARRGELIQLEEEDLHPFESRL